MSDMLDAVVEEVQSDPMRRGSSIFTVVGEGLSVSVGLAGPDDVAVPFTHALRACQAVVRAEQERANDAARRLHALRKESVIAEG